MSLFFFRMSVLPAVFGTRFPALSINTSGVNQEESMALDVPKKKRDHHWDQPGSTTTGGHFFQRKRHAGIRKPPAVQYKDLFPGLLLRATLPGESTEQVYVVTTPVMGNQVRVRDQTNKESGPRDVKRFSFYLNYWLCRDPLEGNDACPKGTLVLVNGLGYDHPDAKLPDAKLKGGVPNLIPNPDYGLLFGTVVQPASSMDAKAEIRVEMAGESEEQWHKKWHDMRGFGMVPRENVVAVKPAPGLIVKASLEMPSQAKYLWTGCAAKDKTITREFGQMKAGDVVSQEVLDGLEEELLQSVLNHGYIREASLEMPSQAGYLWTDCAAEDKTFTRKFGQMKAGDVVGIKKASLLQLLLTLGYIREANSPNARPEHTHRKADALSILHGVLASKKKALSIGLRGNTGYVARPDLIH